MQSSEKGSSLKINKNSIIVLFFVLLLTSLFLFRNLFFQPTLILKNLGEQSIEPVIAFKNNKPTFLEFYAEWCEVCKAMAPKVNGLKGEYENDINFVFLNVDNPKWERYIRKFEVNGIPQVNLFDKTGNLKSTFIGKNDEKDIKSSLENLITGFKSNQEIFNSESSLLKNNKNYEGSPRSHG